MSGYFAYRLSALSMTSVSVSPRSAARSCAARHTSSGTRTERSGVCVGLATTPLLTVEVPAKGPTVWVITCGDCGETVGVADTPMKTWPYLERHRCPADGAA